MKRKYEQQHSKREPIYDGLTNVERKFERKVDDCFPVPKVKTIEDFPELARLFECRQK